MFYSLDKDASNESLSHAIYIHRRGIKTCSKHKIQLMKTHNQQWIKISTKVGKNIKLNHEQYIQGKLKRDADIRERGACS